MKILSEATLTKFVDTSFEESQVVVVRSQWLDDLAKEGEEAPVLPRATIVNLSDNKLTSASIQRLWQMFPSAWWIDLSDNNIKDFDFPLPVVLGSLSLTGNTMDAKELETLAKVHILRIKLTPLSAVSVGLSSKAAGVTLITTKLLPNVWVVNDDFISFSDRVRSTKFHLSQQNIETGEAAIGEVTSINITVPQRITAGDWSAIRASPKASSLACVLQEIALSTPESDFFRLDVLLEDYLEEASIYNKFVRKLQIFNNSAVKPLPFMPIVDIQELVELPHRLRLDLSAALTASLLFHIPPILFKEALITAMLKHLSLKSMETMLKLPAFVKTAVVCLLRRLCKRELEEIRITQTLVPKPRAVGGLSNPCTYVTADGFNYLRPARKYLERDITVPEYHEECQSPTLDPSNPASPLYFSDLELDMLDNLPDTPTISSSAEAVHDLLDAGRKGVALGECNHLIQRVRSSNLPNCFAL